MLSGHIANDIQTDNDLNHLRVQEDIHALASKAEFLVLTRSNTDLRRSSGWEIDRKVETTCQEKQYYGLGHKPAQVFTFLPVHKSSNLYLNFSKHATVNNSISTG